MVAREDKLRDDDKYLASYTRKGRVRKNPHPQRNLKIRRRIKETIQM